MSTQKSRKFNLFSFIFGVQSILLIFLIAISAGAIEYYVDILGSVPSGWSPTLFNSLFKMTWYHKGPSQYPLTFTVLIVAIVSLIGSLILLAKSIGQSRGPIYGSQLLLALIWTPIFFFSLACFINLKGPPTRTGCGYGTSNLADFGHNLCMAAPIDYAWFALTILVFVFAWAAFTFVAFDRHRRLLTIKIEQTPSHKV